MLTDDDRQILDELRAATLTILRESLGDCRQVALVDAPNQRNVGDALIWAGEIAYISQLGLEVKYVADHLTYDERSLRRAMPHGTVLLHGGGNLGDLWIGHQLLREKVLTELPDYQVIQLPQSIEFTDRDRAGVAQQVLEGHSDFHLLLRDSLSMHKARELFPRVRTTFCPDMALGWDAPPSRPSQVQPRRVLTIARADKEASSGLPELEASTFGDVDLERTDWSPRGWRLPVWQGLRRTAHAYELYVRARRRRLRWLPVGVVDRAGAKVIAAINRLSIAGAVALYEPASVVVTDRLHAHVLAVLMGRRHVVLDNNYRKVSTIFDDYTGRFSTANYASSLDEAADVVTQLVKN